MMHEYLLELQHISKNFPGVKALSDVSIVVNRGEVHALVGENGAGKSTLMNILSGNLPADKGNILLEKNLVSVTNPVQASALGIRIVHQERSLVENLTVAENIFPENPPKGLFGLINYRKLHLITTDLLTRLRIEDVPTDEIVSRLSSSQKQMVQIAKALASPCKVLILDEPTAFIGYRETSILFNMIRGLKSQGVSVIYITHRMNEIMEIADVISVLKDGQYQGAVKTRETSIQHVVRMMVGRDIEPVVRTGNVTSEVALDVQNLSGHHFANISFQLRRGEVLGFAGLVGSGRTELAKAIFGDQPFFSGRIYKEGISISPDKPRDVIVKGVGYVPDDRINLGIFPDMTVEENITVSGQKKFWLNAGVNRSKAKRYIDLLKIKTFSLHSKMTQLSGGNQQKVVLARWLGANPNVLIVDEPTQGVDIASKFEIYEILEKLSKDGVSIMLISSELPELLLMSDRIAVMHEGQLKKILMRKEATEETIVQYASGNSH